MQWIGIRIIHGEVAIEEGGRITSNFEVFREITAMG